MNEIKIYVVLADLEVHGWGKAIQSVWSSPELANSEVERLDGLATDSDGNCQVSHEVAEYTLDDKAHGETEDE